MTEVDWTALEDAVLAALQAQLANQVNTLESYQGDWRADLQAVGWRLPAVSGDAGGHQLAGRGAELL